MARSDLSPMAQKVYDAWYCGGEEGAIAASFGEPVAGFDSRSERDNSIKEFGLCIGLAYAIVAFDNPFLGGTELANAAEVIGREAFFELRPEHDAEREEVRA